MIYFLIPISFIGILILGCFICFKRGRAKGFAVGFGHGLLSRERMNRLVQYESKLDRYQCSITFIIRKSWSLDEIELATTSQTGMLCDSFVKMLISNGVVRPYIISKEPGGNDREIWTIGLSAYVANDPGASEFGTLPFIHV